MKHSHRTAAAVAALALMAVAPVAPAAREQDSRDTLKLLAHDVEDWSLAAEVLGVVVHPRQPQVAYAGTRDQGVFKSEPAGGAWQQAAGDVGFPWWMSLAMDPEDPQVLYATGQTGLYKTTDAAASWTKLAFPFPDSSLVVTDPRRAGIVYAAPSALFGLFKSEDGGQTWRDMSAGLSAFPVRALGVDPESPDVLYAGTWRGGIDKSVDGAQSWVNVGLRNAIVYEVLVSAGRVFAVTDLGIYRSSDAGASWTLLAAPSPAQSFLFLSLAVDPSDPDHLLAGTSVRGIWQSTDGGQSWTETPAESGWAWVHRITFHPVHPSLVFAGSGSGLYWSRDGGRSWRR